MMKKLHGIIFSYLSNPDLRELTIHRNTCSLPYGGRYRVVDFMLSSMVNAGISDIGMIVHTNYQSLLDHLGSGKDWDLSRKHGGLRILPPFGYAEKKEEGIYRGRMDALAGVRSYLENIRQDHVILAGGDLALNLPIADVYEQHMESGADITAVWTRRGASQTWPSAPTPPRAASPWRSTFSPRSCCSPWWTTAPPTTSPPSAAAYSSPCWIS